jgi:tRNA threonylcarbamoyladenosine biosynthesis protein TsaB
MNEKPEELPRIMQMKILAFDTSWDVGVAGTLRGTSVVEKTSGQTPRAASEGLLPWIMDVTARSGWKPSDLDLIAVGRGPGSFTGTRIAVSVAKGLAETLRVPLVSVSSAEAVALTRVQEAGRRVAVVMDARKSQVMVAVYRVVLLPPGVGEEGLPGVETEVAPRLAAPHEAGDLIASCPGPASPCLVCGDGVERYPSIAGQLPQAVTLVRPQGPMVDPSAVAALAVRRFLLGEADDPASLEPVYLRGYD